MPAELILLLSYIVLGLVAGVMAGLMGIGGGIVIVPALYFLFAWQGFSVSHLMQLAVATSLATIIFTAFASARAHHRRGAVEWPVVFILVPGIVLGAVAGGLLARLISSDWLRLIFGIFEIAVAIQIGIGAKPPASRALPGRLGMNIAGTGIGGLSALLGIGGGTLTVPFLLWCNVAIHRAVAISAACGLPIALAGTLAMMAAGWGQPELPAHSLGYVYWPAALAIVFASFLAAPLGVRLAHALPVVTLKRVFAVLLAIVGLRMVL